jgi:hypothetical protein
MSTENARNKLVALRDLTPSAEDPTASIALTASLSGLMAIAAEPPPMVKGIIGVMVKFDKVGYFKGRSRESYPLYKRLRFINLRDAWCYLRDQNSDPERTIWRNADGYLPDRKDLGELDQSQWPVSSFNGKPEDPYKHSYFIYLYDPEIGEFVTFVTQSGGGERAVLELASRVKAYNKTCPGAFPIIELQANTWDTKQFKQIAKPHFPIAAWVDAEGRPLREPGEVIDMATATAIDAEEAPFEVEEPPPVVKKPNILRACESFRFRQEFHHV